MQKMTEPGYFVFRPGSSPRLYVELTGHFAGVKLKVTARRGGGDVAAWFDVPVATHTDPSATTLDTLSPADGVPVCYVGDVSPVFDLYKVTLREMAAGPCNVEISGAVEEGPVYFSGAAYVS